MIDPGCTRETNDAPTRRPCVSLGLIELATVVVLASIFVRALALVVMHLDDIWATTIQLVKFSAHVCRDVFF